MILVVSLVCFFCCESYGNVLAHETDGGAIRQQSLIKSGDVGRLAYESEGSISKLTRQGQAVSRLLLTHAISPPNVLSGDGRQRTRRFRSRQSSHRAFSRSNRASRMIATSLHQVESRDQRKETAPKAFAIGDRVKALIPADLWKPRPLRVGDVGVVVFPGMTEEGEYMIQFDEVRGTLYPEAMELVAKATPKAIEETAATQKHALEKAVAETKAMEDHAFAEAKEVVEKKNAAEEKDSLRSLEKQQQIEIAPIFEVDDVDTAAEVVAQLLKMPDDIIHACDTEVANITFEKSPVGQGNVICISIYSGPDADYGRGPGQALWVDTTDEAVLEAFRPFLESERSLKVWHNYGFDRHVLWNHNITVRGFGGDTMHMARLWDASRQRGYSLEALTDELVGRRKVPMKEIFSVPKLNKKGLPGKLKVMPPVEELQNNPLTRGKWIEYSTYDSQGTWLLHAVLVEKLQAMEWQNGFSLYEFYTRYWRPFGELLTDMEHEGIKVDVAIALPETQVKAEAARKRLELEFRKWAASFYPSAWFINPDSKTQIGTFLFGGDDSPPSRSFEMTKIEYERLLSEWKRENSESVDEKDYHGTQDEVAVRDEPKDSRGESDRAEDMQEELVKVRNIEAEESTGKLEMNTLIQEKPQMIQNDSSVGGNILARCNGFSIEALQEALRDGSINIKKANVEINIRSIGIRNPKRTKTGAPKTDVATLREFAGQPFHDPPVYGLAYEEFHGGEAGIRACEAIASLIEKESVNTFRRWAASFYPAAWFISPESRAQLGTFLFGGGDSPRSRTFKLKKDEYEKLLSELRAQCFEEVQNIESENAVAALGRESHINFSGLPSVRTDDNKRTQYSEELNSESASTVEANNENQGVEQGSALNSETQDIGDDSVFKVFEEALEDGSINIKNTKVETRILSIGMRNPKRTKTGAPKTDAATLREFAGQPFDDPPVYGMAKERCGGGAAGERACKAIASLIEKNAIDTLLGTFILPLQANADSRSRIHSSLNLNTETGRLSSRTPNLQNQPAHEKDIYKIRDAFCADDGNALVVADYGQLELRLLAHMASCRSMIDAFKAGGCFHSRTAVAMFDYVKRAVDSGEVLLEWDYSKGKPTKPLLKDVYGSERRKAKALNFGLAYGKTVHGLANDFGISKEEAQEILDSWYADRPEVSAWQKKTIDNAHKTGATRTLLGRYRPLQGISSPKQYVVQAAERAAINTPIQGGAADIMTLAMLKLARSETLKKLGYKLLLQIHDEVILEGPKEYADLAKDEVVACMENPFDDALPSLEVDLVVDANSAQTWYDAK